MIETSEHKTHTSDRLDAHRLETVVLGSGPAAAFAILAALNNGHHVTVLEKYAAPGSENGNRKQAVPQEIFVHALSTHAVRELVKIFPDFVKDVQHAGGGVVNLGSPETNLDLGAGRLTVDLCLETGVVNRAWFEKYLWEKITAHHDVTIIEHVNVQELLFDNTKKLAGISYRIHEQSNVSAPIELRADNVIVATGRRDTWIREQLKQHGAQLSEPREVHSHAAYAAVNVKGEDLHQSTKVKLTATPESVEHPLACVLSSQGFDAQGVEIFTAMVIRVGIEKRDIRKGREFLQLLKETNEDVYEILKDAVAPNQKVRMYYDTESVDNAYYDVENWIDGLYLIGDALASMNPRYGQGITLALLESFALEIALAEGDKKKAMKSYMKKVKKIIQSAWFLTVLGDSRFPDTEAVNYEIPGWMRKMSPAIFEALGHAQARSAKVATISFAMANDVPVGRAVLSQSLRQLFSARK